MEKSIQLTEAFLKEQFDKSEYFNTRPEEKTYRLEHSYRVANIGRQIALAEGLNAEHMTVGCLLHDVSYCMDFKDSADSRNHGRYSAHIARPFVESLGYDAKSVNDILYGIAIHVDDKADFEGERNSFTLSIGDADNIDRFDAYRIYETLRWRRYDEVTSEEREAHVNKALGRLNELKNMHFATPTGDRLWQEKLDYQIGFYERLKNQIDMSRLV